MIKNFVIAVAAIAVLNGATLSANAQQSESLTLNQAIQIALLNNRAAKNARIEVEKAGDKVAALRTRRLPGFSLDTLISKPLNSFGTNFDQGVFGTYPGIGPVPAETTVITSSTKPTALVIAQIAQPLTQLRRIAFQIRQQEVGKEISLAELHATEQTVVNDVKRAYYAILQTQGQSHAAAESVKLYRELDRVTGDYVLQQVALKTDQMDVQTRLAKAEYQLLTLDHQLTSQKEQLNLLMGRDVNTMFTVSNGGEMAQVTMRETDLVQARQRALQQRPELRQARLKVQQADLDRRAKKTEFIPDVSMTYNYVSTFNYSDFVPRSVSSIGVQVEWEIFDWGRKKRELREKTRTVTQANTSLQEAESQVVMEVNDRFRRLQESCQLIRIAQLAQTHARANVQMATYRYRVEAVLLKDVLQAQTSLADADYEYQKALLSFWTAKADFEKALGEDK